MLLNQEDFVSRILSDGLVGLEKKIKLSAEDTLVHPLFSYVNGRGSHDEEGPCRDSVSANSVPLKPGTN